MYIEQIGLDFKSRSCVKTTTETVLSQVKRDAALVWKNCRLYNSRPSDEPVREMCTEVELEFKKLWTKAGLEGPEPSSIQHQDKADGDELQEEEEAEEMHPGFTEVDESSVPEQYNVFQGMSL